MTNTEELLQLMTGAWVSQMLSVVARCRIADELSHGPRRCNDVAAAVGVDPAALYRIWRTLSRHGVTTITDAEPIGDSELGLTAKGDLLRSGVAGSLQGLAALSGDRGQWRCWQELEHSVRTGEAAPAVALGGTVWDHYRTSGAEGAHFLRAMAEISEQAMPTVLDNYDFGRHSVVCDVGGGNGSALRAILERYTHPGGILFDEPEVIQSVSDGWRQSTLRERCKLASGNFFAEVPQADCLLLKNVVHDWPDDKAVTILTNCRQALPADGRVVILESVLADEAPPFPYLLDINMLVVYGGRERTPTEYATLIKEAGLELVAVTPSGLLTILECAVAA